MWLNCVTNQKANTFFFFLIKLNPKNRQFSGFSVKKLAWLLRVQNKTRKSKVGQGQKNDCLFFIIVLTYFKLCVCVYTIFQHVPTAELVRYHIMFAMHSSFFIGCVEMQYCFHFPIKFWVANYGFTTCQSREAFRSQDMQLLRDRKYQVSAIQKTVCVSFMYCFYLPNCFPSLITFYLYCDLESLFNKLYYLHFIDRDPDSLAVLQTWAAFFCFLAFLHAVSCLVFPHLKAIYQNPNLP